MLPTFYLCAALGLTLLAVGLRGRRTDDHPLCRRCRFDLTGKPADSVRCPECGADLSRRRTVRVGHRRRVGWAVGAGVAVLVATAAVTVNRLRHVDWWAHAPLWYVLRQASSVDAAVRTPALAELAGRRADAMTEAEWGRAVEAALAYQRDAAKPWDPDWGAFVEQARDGRHASDEQWHRYAEQGTGPLVLTLSPAVVRPGERLTYRVDLIGGRIGPGPRLRQCPAGCRFDLPGTSVNSAFNWEDGGSVFSLTNAGEYVDGSVIVPMNMQPGRHFARFVTRRLTLDTGFDERPYSRPVFTADVVLTASSDVAPLPTTEPAGN